MDMMSMVTSLLAARRRNTQMQVAATIMKSNADAEKSAVLTLLGAAQLAGQSRRRRRRQSRYFGLKPGRYRLHRRLDQLDGVVAGPFRGAGDGGDLAALAVDQHRGRHAQRPAYAFKILKNLGFLVAEIAEPGQIGVFQEILRLFGVAGVDVDRRPPRNSARRAWSAGSSSAGISLRQGTHQVAHRFTSTVRPRQSESFLGLPSASSKARSGSRSGAVAMVSAATSPCASGASLLRQLDRRAAGGIAAGAVASARRSRRPRQIRSPPRSAPPRSQGESGAWRPGEARARSGISFVILYQIRLCRAWITVGRRSLARSSAHDA